MRTRRSFLHIAVVALAAILLTGCLDKNQQTTFDLVNQSRTAAGLPALAENEAATKKAQAWAEQLAANGKLSHSTLGDGLASTAAEQVGENVGWHTDGIGAVHAMYLDSPTHAANIYGKSWTHLGVGVAEKDGRTYTVHVFLRVP